MPVGFDCACGFRWFSPPAIACPRCGPRVASTPDPIIWSAGQVPGTSIWLTAQMRDEERFARFVEQGIEVFVDVAGSASYIWRPDAASVREHEIRYVRVDDVDDTNIDLPEFAFDAVASALEEGRAGRSSIVFCAAGLKRSPHLLYGVLRSWGYDAASAWAAVSAARPFVDQWDPYLVAAERWVASRTVSA